GLTIAPEKIQLTSPFKFLGLLLLERTRTVTPQPLKIADDPKTLHQLQRLCGSINWLRPFLGLNNTDLAPLFELLKGSDDLTSPRTLTPDARAAIQRVADALSHRKVHRCNPALPFRFAVVGECPHFYGLIFQWDHLVEEDPLYMIEWIFLSYSPTKTITTPVEQVSTLITRASLRLQDMAGCDFICIHVPWKKSELERIWQTNQNFQLALGSFPGQVSVHYPKHKIFTETFKLMPRTLRSHTPLKALIVYTDGSGRSKKSVIVWKDPDNQEWESDVQVVEGSPQIIELAAVVRAFKKFDQAFNLVTDSAYVAGVVQRAENSLLKHVENERLFSLLLELVQLLSHRRQPYFVMHIRSHTDLLGPITEGNRRADQLALAANITSANVPDIFTQAKMSHMFFDQNAPALARMFKITQAQAQAIVSTCPNCQSCALPTVTSGANPRGLGSLELWQTDITHYAPFGRLKYIHVSVDTFSHAIFASVHAGEKTKYLKKHLMQAFAALGIPKQIKSDNGPAFSSKAFKEFCQEWGIQHLTGIPHNPTGQSIVERTHKEIK
ncbi:PO113 protein, partial [Dicaeum eximium]|nr:PO113 protein [Dicaeum eximium]